MAADGDLARLHGVEHIVVLIPSLAPDGAGHPLVLHDFQEQFLKFALTMRHLGQPPGRP